MVTNTPTRYPASYRLILSTLIVIVGIASSSGFTQGLIADRTESVESLEFESRFALYRYLQRGLEQYFDYGDSSQIAELEATSQIVVDSFGDDFYLRQCRKFRAWRAEKYSQRNQLKANYAANLSGLSGEDGPVDIYQDQMAELGDEFLEFGDSVAAVNCWQYGAGWPASREEAQGLLGKAVLISRLVGDRDGLSRSFSLMGRLFEQNTEFISAGDYFDSARVIKVELGDDAGVADALSNIASIYLSIGERVSALRFAEQALQLRRDRDDSVQVLHSLLTMIPAFARDVSIATAEGWLDETLQLSQSQSVPQQAERLSYCSAVIAELQGSIDTAVSLYSQSLVLATTAKNSRLALAVLQNLAALEAAMGRYTEAVTHYVNAKELATSTRNRVAQATVFHNLGSLHQRLGDLEQASDYYQRALDIRKQMDMRIQSIETLSNLAELYLTTGEFSTAEIYVRQAAQIAKLTNDRRRLAAIFTRLAHLKQLQGDHDGAMATLDSAAMTESELLTLQRRIDYLCLQADFSRQSQAFPKTSRYLSKAYLLLDSCATYSNCQRIDIISAALAVDQANWHKAYQFLAAVIARSEQTRGSIPDPQLRTSFQSQSRFVYEQMVRTLFNLRKSGGSAGLEDSLLVYLEKAKSRSLLDAMSRRDDPPGTKPSSRLEADEKMLLRKIDQAENSLIDDSDPQSIKRTLALLAELDHRLADLRLKSSVDNASSVRIYAPTPIPISRLQSSLPDDRTALISFLLAPEESYAIRIDRSQFVVERLRGRSEISSAVAEFARLIQLSIKDESLLDSLEEISGKLGDWLLPSSLLPAGAYERILISADGILNVLPFEALRLENKYLIEYASVAYVPSLFLYKPADDKQATNKKTRLLAIADPRANSQQRQLPFSAREVDWISDIFGKENCTILTAADATKGELLQLPLSDYDIIHAATHSTINYADPRRSKIWLSADTTSIDNESSLTLDEVDDLKLTADLVVLSSCESGGGKLDIGEGMDGFVKAFMHAGANNILVSLWEVEDFTTATFMKIFYQNLNSGYAEALRTAKLEMIASPRLRHRHPYYWSPFKLTVGGNWRRKVGSG